MTKKELMIIADYSHATPLTLEELCEACGISSDFINDLLEYEIIQLEGDTPDQWVFDLVQLQRIKTAIRLQRDLEVNFAGIAVVLDLLEEIERLRRKAELLERHFK